MIRVLVTGAAGRMGHEVVRAVTDADGMEVVAAVDPGSAGITIETGGAGTALVCGPDLALAIEESRPDVVVDFTHPTVVEANLRIALARGIDCVVGTTGLSEARLAELAVLATPGTALFFAPNFAIGAVLMMDFAARAARYLPHAEVIELHHDQKADSPSGTALRTASIIAAARAVRPSVPGRETELLGMEGARGAVVDGVHVHSIRLPGLVAHQEVLFGGQGQTLSIRHDTIDRTSFMPGVVLAVREVGSREGLVIGLEKLMGGVAVTPTEPLPIVVARKPVVVMKFGGTSVADVAGRTALIARVRQAVDEGRAPVVVVSAMGRQGAPYATDTLLGLVAQHPAEERESDLLASVGEVISAVVVAHELRDAGLSAQAFTGPEAGIVTDGVYGDSSITQIFPGGLFQAIDAARIPVIAGFQGMSEDGRTTTLGRGGSDTSACALGVALSAEEVEIYTDVDGVMTADPRTCDGSSVIDVIGADELFQMAKAGSRVVHTPAAELALNSGIAVRVRSTFSDHNGTLVADIAGYRPDRVATAVSHTIGIARVRVRLFSPEGTRMHMTTQTRIYRLMADARVSLDMFTPVGDDLVFTVQDHALREATSVLDRLGLPYDARTGLAKVTLVGAGMHGVPGVMARMAEFLSAAGVDVYQAADSHTTISVLVAADQTESAVRALHEGFQLGVRQV